MTADIPEWNGRPVLNRGTLVILWSGSADPARLVAGTSEGVVTTFGVTRWAEFVSAHLSTVFVSVDGIPPLPVVDPTAPGPPRPTSDVAAVLDQGRWFDLRLLDQLLRIAGDGPGVCVRRTEEQLVAEFVGNASVAGQSRSQNSPNLYQNCPVRDRIRDVFFVLEALSAQANQFTEEVALPREAEFRLTPPDEAEAAVATVRRFVLDLVERRAVRGRVRDVPGEGPVRSAPGVEVDEAHSPNLSAGVGVLVRGQFALERVNAVLADSDVRSVGDTASLREVAERRYREASATLHMFPEAVDAFRWDGELVSRRNGRPSTSKALRGWLTTASRRLADRWGERVCIPRSGEGYPVENPEHWGCWVAGDGGLWAWREVVRMAEVLRFVERPTPPSYELLPRLRSMGPNLAVYRSLGVPVLRPRPGHVFLAGRVCDLRLCCFAAVGLGRGYFPRGHCRLAGHFLRRGDPLAEIAGELFAAVAGRQATLPLADDAAEEETRAACTRVRRRADERFAELSRADAVEAAEWRRLARGLMHAAVLGIPDARLGEFLRHEHQSGDVGGAVPATEMLKLLASDVVYELQFCLTDNSADTVNARLGRSAQDEVHRRHESSHPDTFHERVRNRVSGDAGVAGLDLGPDPYPPDGPIADVPPAQGRRPDLFLIRGQTLGGRFTARGSQAVVLQAEVLGSEDDVMLEVAFALSATNYRVLAVAGEEFLVEVPERGVDAVVGRVREIAEAGARRWLGNLATISVDVRDSW